MQGTGAGVLGKRERSPEDLASLDAAERGSAKAPTLDNVARCRVQALNDVTAVAVVISPGWFNGPASAATTPGRVTVSIQESHPDIPYAGVGTAAVAGAAQLFTNAGCTVPVPLFLSAGALRGGVPLYVLGGAAGNTTVTLTLTVDPNPAVRTGGPATGNVVIQTVNVVTPTLAGDELVLVHNGDAADPTTLSAMTVGVAESVPGRDALGDVQVTLDYGAQMDCFEDAGCTVACASGTAIARARLPLALFVRGANEGDSQVTASVSSSTGAPHRNWAAGANAAMDVRVEELILEAFRVDDGRATGVLAGALVGGGRLRELHAQNGAGTFTNARLRVRQPSARFWTKADRVTLATTAGIQVCSDPAAGVVVANLEQGDFAGANLDLWVRTTAAVAMDAGPGGGAIDWHAWAAVAPERVVTRRRVSCGARTLAPKALSHGSLQRLDTFGFDQHLDRMTANECGDRITGGGVLGTDVALARAAAHGYYGHESTYKVNLNFGAVGGGPFNAFLDSMNFAPGNNATWAAAGADWVEVFLLNHHGVVLTGVMKTRIQNHIRNVLSGATVINGGTVADFRFARLYGVPGVHAECLAVNELVAGPPALLPANLTVATYLLQDQPLRRGKRFIACPNCRGVLLAPGGPRVITG